MVQPFAEEVLDGYLERASYVLEWPVLLVRRSLGLPEPTVGPPIAIFVNSTMARNLDYRLAVQPGTVKGMTVLGRYTWLETKGDEPSAADLTRQAARRWYFIAGSRYCPTCLRADGVWRTSWRMPWTLACTQHQLRLNDMCPGCGGWPRSGTGGIAAQRRADESVRIPHLCHLPLGDQIGRGSKQCGADLTESDGTPANGSELDLQFELNSALDGTSVTIAGTQLSGRDAMTAWQELALIGAHLQQHTRARTRLSPPRKTETISESLQLVHQVARQVTHVSAAEALHTIFREKGVQVDKNWFRDRLPRQTSPIKHVYEELLQGEGRVSTQLRRSHQQTLGLFPVKAEQIPHLFWKCNLPRVLADLDIKPTVRMRSVFVSLAMARILIGNWETAAESLGLPRMKGRQWSRYVIGAIPIRDRRTINAAILDILSLLGQAPIAARPAVVTTQDLLRSPWPGCVHLDSASKWCPCVAQKKALT